MSTAGQTINLADFEHDEMTLAMVEMVTVVTGWSQESRDEVHETLGALAILAGTGVYADHRLLAELLTIVRRLITGAENRYQKEAV